MVGNITIFDGIIKLIKNDGKILKFVLVWRKTNSGGWVFGWVS